MATKNLHSWCFQNSPSARPVQSRVLRKMKCPEGRAARDIGGFLPFIIGRDGSKKKSSIQENRGDYYLQDHAFCPKYTHWPLQSSTRRNLSERMNTRERPDGFSFLEREKEGGGGRESFIYREKPGCGEGVGMIYGRAAQPGYPAGARPPASKARQRSLLRVFSGSPRWFQAAMATRPRRWRPSRGRCGRLSSRCRRRPCCWTRSCAPSRRRPSRPGLAPLLSSPPPPSIPASSPAVLPCRIRWSRSQPRGRSGWHRTKKTGKKGLKDMMGRHESPHRHRERERRERIPSLQVCNLPARHVFK